MKQEIIVEIEQQVALTEKRGEKVVKYLEMFRGQSIFNDIALAIEFGYQLKLEETKQENCCTPLGQIKRYEDCYGCNRKPKQETLEEVAEKFTQVWFNNNAFTKELFIEGIKWQQQNSYSKEEVNVLISLLKQTTEYEVLQSFRDKVEQFKKK